VITNGPTASPDNRTRTHRYPEEAHLRLRPRAGGTLSKRRVFAQDRRGDGYPDGPITDSQGCVWSGLYGGWGVN